MKGLGSVAIRGDADIEIAGSNNGKNVDVSMASVIDLNIQIDTKDGSTIQLSGSIEPPPSTSSKSKTGNISSNIPKINIDTINYIKAVKVGPGIISLNPRYNIGDGFDGIQIGYGVDNTSLNLDTKSKRLTVTQNFLESNSISPSITADGDISLSYSRNLSDGNKLTTAYTPNNSIKVIWEDNQVNGWQTTIKAPLDGYIPQISKHGIQITTKRNL